MPQYKLHVSALMLMSRTSKTLITDRGPPTFGDGTFPKQVISSVALLCVLYCHVDQSMCAYHSDLCTHHATKGLGVETERVPGVETERAMSGPLLRQGVETERECAKNVTGVALWRGSKPNARGSKPNAGSISCGRRRLVALSLAKKWFDIILPSMYM